MAEALHRKYRPQVFSDVVGQDHIERTLKNAIEADQVSHAYLFSGPRGTGKTTTARLLAKALLCQHGPTSEPDGTCEECTDIANGTHPDVYELDAASRTGVDNVREEIISRVNYAPTRGKWKVYIIDEVHMLSTAAFNALLKTIEEPPEHIIFILCTTDPQKIPETIQSRCQRFEFRRLSNDEIVTRLGAICVAEGVEFEGDALDLIAHRAEGGMRNALTSLEQLIAFGEGRVTVQGAEDLLGSLGATDMAEIMQAVGKRDIATCFTWTADYVESGADLAQFARDMAEHVRNLYVMSLAGTDVVLEIPEAERRQLNDELGLFGSDRLARLLGVLGDLVGDMRTATNPRLAFEVALTRMVRPDSDLTLEALAERIEALEAGYSAAAPHMSVPAAAVPNMSAPAAQVAALSNNGIADVADLSHTQPASTPSSMPVEVGKVGTNETVSDTGEPLVSSLPASGFDKSEVEGVLKTSVGASEQETPPANAASSLDALLTNPAALQRVWMSVMGAIKKEKQAFAAMLVGVRAHAAQNGSGIVVEFPASNPISLSMAKKPDMQDLLARTLEAAAGFAVPFECVAGGASDVQPNSATADTAVSAPIQPAPVFSGLPDLPPEPDTLASATPAANQDADLGANELSKMLSDTMGSSVVFEEVDEQNPL